VRTARGLILVGAVLAAINLGTMLITLLRRLFAKTRSA
jgi:hypothetical protein